MGNTIKFVSYKLDKFIGHIKKTLNFKCSDSFTFKLLILKRKVNEALW